MSQSDKSILDRIIGGFIGALILIACFVLFVNVVLRALGYSLKWAEELTRYIIVWVTFIGGSMCIQDGTHVGIDVLPSRLGPKGKLILSIIINLISLAFVAVMAYLGVEMVMPGDKVSISVELIAPIAMEKTQRFAIREGGRTVASGRVTEILA